MRRFLKFGEKSVSWKTFVNLEITLSLIQRVMESWFRHLLKLLGAKLSGIQRKTLAAVPIGKDYLSLIDCFQFESLVALAKAHIFFILAPSIQMHGIYPTCIRNIYSPKNFTAAMPSFSWKGKIVSLRMHAPAL